MLYFFPNSLATNSKDIKKNRIQTRRSHDNRECLVFSTSIKRKEDKKYISEALDSISEISNWTLDLEDCDKVLKVEFISTEITSAQIIQALDNKGVYCFELD